MVSTHLKNISQIGNLPQIGMKIKNIWNHHLVIFFCWICTNYPGIFLPKIPSNHEDHQVPILLETSESLAHLEDDPSQIQWLGSPPFRNHFHGHWDGETLKGRNLTMVTNHLQVMGSVQLFHQPIFPWNKGISLPKRYLLGEIGRVLGRYNLTRWDEKY